jgi:hypothetical protein
LLNDVIDGIVGQLTATFGDNYRVYTEQVKQGLNEPCFIVSCVNPANTPLLGKRSRRTNLFSVTYIPQSDTDAKAECYDVQDSLFTALEYITVDGALQRGTNMSGEFIDGTLVFSVNYNYNVYTPTEYDIMEDLTIQNQAKGKVK